MTAPTPVSSRERFELFVRDFFSFAAGRRRVSASPPATAVFIVPEWGWAATGSLIARLGQMPPETDWSQSFAASAYMPSTMERRLRVMAEIQAEGRSGEYDKYLDAEAFVWVREPSGLDSDLAGLERYSRLATATARPVPFAAAGKAKATVADRPDRDAIDLFREFLVQMTPDEFIKRYRAESRTIG
jgi:hypothetical protein